MSVARICTVLEGSAKVAGDRHDRGTINLTRAAHRCKKIRTGPRSRNRSAQSQR
jgi:hypothetical protein